MLEYVEDCLKDYRTHGSESKLVKSILNRANQEARKRSGGKYMVQNATKALVQISRKWGPDKFIPLNTIKDEAKTKSSPRGGLWPWVFADILEGKTGPKSYKIRASYYSAMLELFPEENASSDTHRIMELAGLGKEIWKGVDPDRYVREERPSWRG